MDVAPTETGPVSVGGRSSSLEGCVADERGEAETAPGDVSVQQECSGGRHGVGAGVVSAAVASDRHYEDFPSGVGDLGASVDGSIPPPSALLPASTATVFSTSSLSDTPCKEPTASDYNQPPVTGDRNCEDSNGARYSKDDNGSKAVSDRRRLPEPGPLTLESLSGVELVCGDIFREAW